MAKLRITYAKSVIGYSKDQKATVKSLGLQKLNSSVIQDDTPAIRGMAFKVRHLVRVEEVADTTLAATPTVKFTARPTVVAEPTALQSVVLAPSSATTVDLGGAAEPTSAATTVDLGGAAEPIVAPEVTSNSTPNDDLEIIEGIGPKIADVLAEQGITTFARLAETSVDRLSSILTEANLRRLSDPGTWPEQARLAANGQLDELKALQDVLQGGRAAS